MNLIGSQSVSSQIPSQFSNFAQTISQSSDSLQSVLVVPESFAPQGDLILETQSQPSESQLSEVDVVVVEQNPAFPFQNALGPIQAQIPVMQLNVMEIRDQVQTSTQPNQRGENHNNNNNTNLSRVRRRLFEPE